MKKIWLSMFYSIRVGEDPDSVFVKKIEKSEPSQDDTDQPLLLAPKILPFSKELELHLFSISIQEFLCVSTPLCDPEKFLFLGTHTRFVTTKRIMVTPPLTISFINYVIYEFHSNRNQIHVYPTETEFVTCYPLA